MQALRNFESVAPLDFESCLAHAQNFSKSVFSSRRRQHPNPAILDLTTSLFHCNRIRSGGPLPRGGHERGDKHDQFKVVAWVEAHPVRRNGPVTSPTYSLSQGFRNRQRRPAMRKWSDTLRNAFDYVK
jgi:hypothetical protein